MPSDSTLARWLHQIRQSLGSSATLSRGKARRERAVRHLRTRDQAADPWLAEERQLLSAPAVVLSTASATYTENAPPVTLDPAVTASDPDADFIQGAQIKITDYEMGQDQLSFTSQFGITGSFDNNTGILTLSGIATASQYATVLSSVKYENLSENPTDLQRTIEYRITDTEPLTSPAATLTLNLVSVNDPPTISDPGPQTTDEGTPVVFNSIVINDVDAGSNLLTIEFQTTGPAANYTLGNTNGITFLNGTNGGSVPLKIQGTKADLQNALNGLQVQPLDNGQLDLTLVITDELNDSAQVTIPITVNNVDPVLVLNPVSAVNENGVATLSGTITDPGTADTFTLVVDWGDGSAPVTYTYAAGTTTFSETHQYLDDNPTATASDNYTINATLTDDDGGSDTKTTTVTVNNVAPALFLNPVSAVNENGVATLSGTYTDAGTQDTHTLAINWGDGSPVQTITVTAGAFSVTHQYLDDNPTGTSSDTYTISATLTDDDTLSDTKTIPVTVNNVAPVLVLNPVSAVNENGVATLSGTITDPGTADTFTLVVDWGDGSAPVTYTYAAGTTTFSETHQYLDDNPTGTASDIYTISATLTDDDTGIDTQTTTVTVNNVAPVLVLNPVTAVSENGVATLSGTITDPGTADTFTLVVDWGDGTAPVTYTYAAGTTTFSETHQYLDDNPSGTASDSYTISATLTDDDTGTDTKSTTVTVNNVAPVLVLNSVTAISENGVATLSGTITDPGTADTFTLVVDWGDGSAPVTYTYAAGTTTFSETHQYLDDNPTGTSSDLYTISATLTDDDTGTDTKSTTVTVNNVAPVLTLNAVSAVNENGVATLSGTYTDTGTQDTHTLAINWGDGSPVQTITVTGGAFSVTHQYLDDNPTATASDTYTISATLTDDDTGSDTKSTTVTVNNVAPVLVLNPVSAVNENGVATLSGTITDPGTADTFTLVVDWGDGSAPVTYTYAAGTTTFSETHQYLDDNPSGTASDIYTISATLTDDDTGSDTKSTTVTVNNVAPVLTLNAVSAVNENGVATLSGTYTDAGTQDTHTLAINWGDGSPVQTITVTGGTFSVTHQYLDDNPSATASDTYTISATLTDDDTGSNTKTTTVTVNNVAPVLTLNPVATINENGVATLSGTYTDVGTQDTHTLAINWGDGSPVQTITVTGGAFSVTHQYLDDNPTGTASDSYTISATLTDDDTGSNTKTTSVTVNNVAPVLTLNPVATINENGVATLSGTYTDVGTQDTHTLAINWGDGSPVQTITVTGGTFSVTHQYLDDNPTGTTSDSYTISATLKDDDTGANTKSTSVTVNNVAPVLTLNPVTTVNENGVANLSGTIVDPGTADTFTLVVDWGDGTAPVTYTYAAGTTTFSVTHQYLDDNPTATSSDNYTISAKLTDDDTGSDTQTTTVTVNNVAPVLVLNPVSAVNENGVATLSGTITDPGTADTFTLVVDWGDGSAPVTYTYAAGTTTFSETHQYLDDNPPGTSSDNYTISATLTDDDTGVTTKTTTVTVNNVNPTLTLTGPAANTIKEGQFITVTGSATDPANQPLLMPTTINDPLTYTWSVTKDNVAYASGIGNVANFQAVDNGVYVVTMTVSDDDGGSNTKTYTINVANVAPTPSIAGASTGNEGTAITLVASSTDPANQPTTPTDNDSVTYTWSVTKNGNPYVSNTPGTNFTFTPDNEGTYVVTLIAADEDGGISNPPATKTIIVANVAPVATINATDIDGQFYTYVDVSVADPGNDNITVQIVWGDINPDDFLSDPFVNGETATDRVFPTVTHRYLNAPNPQDPLADVQVNFIIKDGTDTVIETIFLKVTGQGIPAGGVYVTPEPEKIVLPVVQAVVVPPAILTQPNQQQVRNEEVVSREDQLTEEDARLVLHVVGPTGVEGPAVTLPDGLLKNLRSLFNKLPDGHYRVYLVQGESRRLVIEVFVRQGRAIDPAEVDQGTQERPPQSQPAAQGALERTPQHQVVDRAEPAWNTVVQDLPPDAVPPAGPSPEIDAPADVNYLAAQAGAPSPAPPDLGNDPETPENADDSGLASLAVAGMVAGESWRRAARRQRAAAVTTGPANGEKIEKTWSRLARRARQWKPR